MRLRIDKAVSRRNRKTSFNERKVLADAVAWVSRALGPLPDADRNLDEVRIRVTLREGFGEDELTSLLANALYAEIMTRLATTPPTALEAPSMVEGEAKTRPETEGIGTIVTEKLKLDKAKKVVEKAGDRLPPRVADSVTQAAKQLEEFDDMKFSHDGESGGWTAGYDHDVATWGEGDDEKSLTIGADATIIRKTTVTPRADHRYDVSITAGYAGSAGVDALGYAKAGGGAQRTVTYKTTLFEGDPRLVRAQESKFKIDVALREEHPEYMAVGDELTTAKTVFWNFGVEIPIGDKLKVSGGRARSDGNTVKITKSGADEITIELSSKGVTDWNAGAAVEWGKLGIDASRTWREISSATRTFTMDLSKKEARAAYASFFESGELPFAFVFSIDSNRGRFGKIQAGMPAGVKLQKLIALEAKQSTDKAAISFMKKALFSKTTSRGEERVRTIEAGQTTTEEKESLETSVGTILELSQDSIVPEYRSGEVTRTTIANLIEVEKAGGERAYTLRAAYALKDTQTSGTEAFIRLSTLNYLFGTKHDVDDDYDFKAKHGESKMVVVGEIDGAAVQKIADASERDVEAAAAWAWHDEVGQDPRTKRLLEACKRVRQVGSAKNPRNRLDALQDYVMSSTVEELGALKKLAGESLKVEVGFSVEHFDKRLQAMEAELIEVDANPVWGKRAFLIGPRKNNLVRREEIRQELAALEGEVDTHPMILGTDKERIKGRIGQIRKDRAGLEPDRPETLDAESTDKNLAGGITLRLAVAAANGKSRDQWTAVADEAFAYRERGFFERARSAAGGGAFSDSAELQRRRTELVALRDALKGEAITMEDYSALTSYLSRAGAPGYYAVRKITGLSSERIEGAFSLEDVERRYDARAEETRGAVSAYDHDMIDMGKGRAARDKVDAFERDLTHETTLSPALRNNWIEWCNAIRELHPELWWEAGASPTPAPIAQAAPVAMPQPLPELPAVQSEPAQQQVVAPRQQVMN